MLNFLKLNERELKHLRVALLICLIAFTVFFAFTSSLMNETAGQPISKWNKIDAEQHYKMSLEGSNAYPWFYSFISQPFNFNERTFYIFSLLLISLVIPLTLFFVVKPMHWVTPLVYFASSFPFISEVIGFFPMAIAALLLILVISKKNWLFRIIALFLALVIHSYAFFLIGFALVILLIFEKPFLFKGFLGCVPGTILPQSLKDSIGGFETSVLPKAQFNFFGLNFGQLTNGQLLNFIFKSCPIIVLPVAFYEWVKTRQWVFIVLFVALFIAAGFYSRILYLPPLLLVFGVVPWFSRQPQWLQRLFFVSLIGFVVLQFYSWLGLKRMNYNVFEGVC